MLSNVRNYGISPKHTCLVGPCIISVITECQSQVSQIVVFSEFCTFFLHFFTVSDVRETCYFAKDTPHSQTHKGIQVASSLQSYYPDFSGPVLDSDPPLNFISVLAITKTPGTYYDIEHEAAARKKLLVYLR